MGKRAETYYARSGDLQIAYQQLGDGGFDLVYVPGFVSHVEVFQQEEHIRRHVFGLASFSRLLFFDKRGTGMSDPWEGAPTLDERMDDIRAVMDHTGVEHASIFAVSEGGPLALLFAATYPERVEALVLYGTGARFVQGDGYPHGPTLDEVEAYIPLLQEGWGVVSPGSLALAAPSMMDDHEFVQEWARARRIAASPKMAAEILRLNCKIDVRDILATIHVPSLVVHRSGDGFVPVEHGRYLAEHLPNGRLVELDGVDHMPFIDADEITAEAEEFLTGHRSAPEPDRALATVLFTDIVGSTERAASEGDARWRSLLDRHDASARREVLRFGGRVVKSTGDGILATFDRPTRAISAARAVVEAVQAVGLDIRAGLHTGEIELRNDDVGGLAVHIGARVGGLAGSGEVLVSSTVKDLVVGSGLQFEERGAHELKGVPGEWRLFAVV